jgi:heterodisulfide reductase subunit B
MNYKYFPGCCMQCSARPYDMSMNVVAEKFGLTFDELEDWNCCGATETISLSKTTAYALVGRNLAIAAMQEGGKQLVASCSSCYQNLKKLDHYMSKYPKVRQITDEVLAAGGMSYDPGTLKIRHLFEVVMEDIGLEKIAAAVTHPLSGLRIAAYYGCFLTRPVFDEVPLDDPQYPTSLDKLVEASGATIADFSLKTECCSGHLTQINPQASLELLRRILKNASDGEADMIVTLCPMCQLNLDAFQRDVNAMFGTQFNMPVIYFTQMIGLALGAKPKALGLDKGIIPVAPVLSKIRVGGKSTG